ncbi:helix-turn-helix domain-containing protein [Sphaerisporangium aureirubrum]|uniref:Helix-turn-helix domain-containing protein n=1 Tax=Sphaerisporangium aureirubrum TaxID=1544736 RepID=A0ABW1NT66_9ACTN
MSSRELDPHESPRALFAFELKRHRNAAGLTQHGLAHRIGYSASLVAMVESLRRPPTEPFARLCDQAMGLDGAMARLYVATTWKNAPENFRPWLEEEQDATGLRSWEPTTVPGLLQTEAYAREMISKIPNITAEQIDERLTGRMQRQSILRRDDAPTISFLMDEGVLHRTIGAPGVMREQLGYLLEISRHPRVTLQIVPYETGAHCGLAGGFIVAERHGSPYIAFIEGQPDGRIMGEHMEIARLMLRYDAIRAEALPSKQSVRLIEEVVNARGE